MRLLIFGLTVSSSWGNGHATLWRGLLRALAQRGHTCVFYERDQPYYANARDAYQPPAGVNLRLYNDFSEITGEVARELRDADVAMVTSYCPDGVAASRFIHDSTCPTSVFYDLDTPVTLQAFSTSGNVDYLPPEGLGAFDLVLSYTGGKALNDLQKVLGAQKVAPLYGWVDPELHHPAPPVPEFRSALNYLGTFAADRQAALEELFVATARRLPKERFVLGGAQYTGEFPWAGNIHFVQHLEPALHPSFFCSARATLNVTRQAMAAFGFCPSGRLFEAAACGAPIISDTWEGLDTFFTSGEEILIARSSADVVAALSLTDGELSKVAKAARARTLRDHTALARAVELESMLEGVRSLESCNA